MPNKKCVNCGHPVAGGGDRHRAGTCPLRQPNSRRKRSARPVAVEDIGAPTIRVARGRPVAAGSKGAQRRKNKQ